MPVEQILTRPAQKSVGHARREEGDAAFAAPSISVIVPVHNNAETVAALHSRLHAAFSSEALELVFVDDASVDASRALLSTLAANLLLNEKRQGQNAAILRGLAHARAPIMCVLDADLQDPPEAMPRLVARLRAGDVHAVFSSRDARFRRSSRLFRDVIQRLFPNLPRTPCLCFAIDRALCDALIRYARPGDYLVAAIGAFGIATATERVLRGPALTARRGLRGGPRVRYAARALRSALLWKWRALLRREPWIADEPLSAVAANAQERARPVRPG